MFKFLKFVNKKVEVYPVQLLSYGIISREMLRMVSIISELRFDNTPGTVTGIPNEICIYWEVDKSKLTKCLDDFAEEILHPLAYKLAKKLKSKKPIACYVIPINKTNICSIRNVYDSFCLATDITYKPGTDEEILRFAIGYIK